MSEQRRGRRWCERAARSLLVAAALVIASEACGSSRPEPRLEDWLRVGVDPRAEADAARRSLEAAGFELELELSGEGWVAFGMRREEDEHRAVRAVTSRGIVLALDSHEPNGVLERHGPVRLVEPELEAFDGSGRPVLVVARYESAREHDCLALVRLTEEGEAESVPIDADGVRPGACAAALVPLEGESALALEVPLIFAELTLEGRPPRIDALLWPEEGEYRATSVPVRHLERARAEREAALATARARLDVPEVYRLAVELAALAALSGATAASRVEHFDEAMRGLVLDRFTASRVDEARAAIRAGFRLVGPDDRVVEPDEP